MGASQEKELLRISIQFGNIGLPGLEPLPTIKTLIEAQLSSDAAFMQSLLVHKVDKMCGAHSRGNQEASSLALAEIMDLIGFMEGRGTDQWNQKNFAIYEENLHSNSPDMST